MTEQSKTITWKAVYPIQMVASFAELVDRPFAGMTFPVIPELREQAVRESHAAAG